MRLEMYKQQAVDAACEQAVSNVGRGLLFTVQFGPNSFQVAFDKGALDALMGEDTDAAAEAGSKLLSEVRRILTAQGQYICVTLAQPHVLSKCAYFTFTQELNALHVCHHCKPVIASICIQHHLTDNSAVWLKLTPFSTGKMLRHITVRWALWIMDTTWH